MEKINFTPRSLPIASLGFLSCLGLSVQAQSPSTPVLETIIVTANRINEDSIDVPQSVTSIYETKLEETGMKDIADLLDAVPALEILPNSPARSIVNIRGLNASLFTNNNPIVIYVDGIPYSSSYGFDLSLVDVEQVDVLRGPQGTLYGKDAIGGVINVITKEPINEWGGKLEAEYGNFNHRGLQLNSSGALKDDVLYFSLSGQYQADDGWVTNNFPGNESDANKFDDQRLSTSLTYKPTSTFQAKLVVKNDDTDSFGTGGYGRSFADLAGISKLSLADTFSRDRAGKITAEFDTREKLEISSQALQLTYKFDDFTISSVSTHRNQELEGFYDFDQSNDPYLFDSITFDNHKRESVTQEFSLQSNDEEGLRYAAGLYFDTDEYEQGPYGQRVFGTNYNGESVTDSSTAAVFGQFIYPVSENLDLTLGGRYQNIDIETDMVLYVDNLPLPPDYTTSFTGVVNKLEGQKDWSVFLSRAALTYKLYDNWNIYSSFSEGYMPGGFNYFAFGGTTDDNTFEPQRSTSYEIGVKGQTTQMIFKAAVFYMDIKDIHFWKTNNDLMSTGNADKAHSQGVDIEIAYKLTDEFELNAALGLIDAEYDDYFTGTYDYSGQRIEQTPEYTFNLGAAYRHSSGFYARADLNATGSTAFFDSGRPAPESAFPERDAYVVINTRLGYLTGDWEFYTYVNNLNDEEYITSLKLFSTVSIATFNDPRTFGAGVRYSF